MKKIICFVFFVFVLSLMDTKILGNTLYNTYKEYSTTSTIKIVSNENFLKENKYYNKPKSSYLMETSNYIVNNKKELINVYYTAVNKGIDSLTFYCNSNYTDCNKDINELSNVENNFSYINELVSVYNSYESIESTYSSDKRVDIKIEKKYKDNDIERINNKINEIVNNLNINDYSDIRTKIKLFHDYIADTNKYDSVRAETKESEYHSDSAIGTLFEGNSICSGYTDTLSLFLDKLKLDNVRVATDKHVWNAVNIDGKWYHIDLTWDDPITYDNSDIITYDYFMLSTEELMNMDDDEHYFNREIYDFFD